MIHRSRLTIPYTKAFQTQTPYLAVDTGYVSSQK